MINVYDNQSGYGKIIARVEANARLDYWDGNNFTNGGVGLHKGITKLRKPHDPDRPYVIIVTSQWSGDKDYGYCVDKDTAVDEILNSGSEEAGWIWPELNEIIEKLEDCEK